MSACVPMGCSSEWGVGTGTHSQHHITPLCWRPHPGMLQGWLWAVGWVWGRCLVLEWGLVASPPGKCPFGCKKEKKGGVGTKVWSWCPQLPEGGPMGLSLVPICSLPSILAMTPLQLGLRANLEGWCWVSVPDAIGAASLWALLIKFQEITFFFFNFILVFFFAVGEEGWDHRARSLWLGANHSCYAALPDYLYVLNTVSFSLYLDGHPQGKAFCNQS